MIHASEQEELEPLFTCISCDEQNGHLPVRRQNAAAICRACGMEPVVNGLRRITSGR